MHFHCWTGWALAMLHCVSMPCSGQQSALVTDTVHWQQHRWTADNSLPLPPGQGGDSQWSVGVVMEGAALADRREYQVRLAEPRRKGLPAAAVGDGSMAEQQLRPQVQQSRNKSRELEQEKQQLQEQLSQQAETYQQELQAAKERAERAQQQVKQLHKQVSQVLNICKEPPILNNNYVNTSLFGNGSSYIEQLLPSICHI